MISRQNWDISYVILPEGFSPLEVTVNFSKFRSSSDAQINELYTRCVGSTCWAEIELKYNLQRIQKIPVANCGGLLTAGGNLIPAPTTCKALGSLLRYSMDVCTNTVTNFTFFFVSLPLLPVLQTLSINTRKPVLTNLSIVRWWGHSVRTNSS